MQTDSMIYGIGTDLVENERVLRACRKESFSEKVFTERERREASVRMRRLVGDFAVKEAAAKALGTGFRDFGPIDIEVLRDELGKPYVELHGGAQKLAAELGIGTIHVSITDTDSMTSAFAVAELK